MFRRAFAGHYHFIAVHDACSRIFDRGERPSNVAASTRPLANAAVSSLSEAGVKVERFTKV